MTAEIPDSADAPAPEPAPVPEGPGARLREAREAKGLDIKDVYQSLRLDEDTVGALENNDYEGLGAPIFVKGYLRSYARLLELDEAQVVADFEAQGRADPPPLKPLVAGAGARHFYIPWNLVGMGAAVIIALLLAWVGYRVFQDLMPAGGEATSVGELLLPKHEPADAGGDGPPAAKARPETMAEEEAAAVEEPPVPDSATELPDGQLVAESELALDFESQVSALETETEPTAAGETAVATASTERVAERSAHAGLLQLTVSEESWVEVYDATDRHLIYGLLKPGQVRRVSGRLPYRVILGNSGGIEVLFDGKLFDQTPYQRGNVARFSLGE